MLKNNVKIILYLFIFFIVTSFIVLPLLKISSFHTLYFDLGIFQSHLFNSNYNSEWQRSFYGHTHWFGYIYSLFYGMYSLDYGVYIIIAFQAVLLLSPAVFLYKQYGLVPLLAYLLYIPLWMNTQYEFHYDHLTVPILAGFFISLIRLRFIYVTFFSILLMLVKEPYALQAAACGLLLIWLGLRGVGINDRLLNTLERKKLIIAGALITVVGFVYFYVAVHYLIPYFNADISAMSLENKAFSHLGASISEILWSILSQPLLIFNDIFTTPRKLLYLIILFGSLSFIPLLKPIFLIPAVPLIMIAMLSKTPNYYDYHAQYTAALIIPIMFSFVYGLPRAKKIWVVFTYWCSNKLIGVRSGLIKVTTKTVLSSSANAYGRYVNDISKYLIDEKKSIHLFFIIIFMVLIISHILLAPSPFARLFWSDRVWSYNKSAYIISERDVMIKKAIFEYIPSNPGVSVATQNSFNSTHLAHRKIYLPFPLGVSEPHLLLDWSNRDWRGFFKYLRSGYKPPSLSYKSYADYIVLDLKRPYSLSDIGCAWKYGECENKNIEKEFFSSITEAKVIFDTVFEKDGFIILRRKMI
jgi:uncharacterized membrane protein